jgi:hypothetical protein
MCCGTEGMKALMPWSIEHDASSLHVRVNPPMLGDWENLWDGVKASLDPIPYAIYLPQSIEGASQADSDMLTGLWQRLQKMGIIVLPPKDEQGI